MRNWIIVCSILLLISIDCCAAAHGGSNPAVCSKCHTVSLTGGHKELNCAACHGDAVDIKDPAVLSSSNGCGRCHAGAEHILHQAMATRSAEQEFCRRSWGMKDSKFFSVNCNGCHVSSCRDCHGSGHDVTIPTAATCYKCHNGYFVGWDYAGRAPREDSVRYQRGGRDNEQYYLKMLPDVHQQAGMECADCHSMGSLQRGQRGSRSCRDCHDIDKSIIEHSIPEHLNKMECVSCHAAWAAQEYATFYLHTANSDNRRFFRVKKDNEQYIKSSYLRRQNLPPLGLNKCGLVAPIRPQFIAYYSAMENNRPNGRENQLLLAQWKAFSPHTIRRGSAMCDSCHADARRFILEPLAKRIYRPDLDGLQLVSFWRSDGQTVVNGSFYPQWRFKQLSAKSNRYRRKYVQKWQYFLKKDAPSCAH